MLVSAVVFAQDADTTKLTLKNFIPTGIRVGTDMLSIGRSLYGNSFNGWEINADVDIHRYFLTVDYGTWSRDLQSANEIYSNDGTYYRIGLDANMLKNDPDKNVFFLGLRYGRSRYSESLLFQVNDPVWGEIQQRYTNAGATARWMELVGGIKVKIWKIVWMGYTARFKFSLKTSDNPLMLSHDVPGFGLTDSPSYWGFNYQILVRLPVRPAH